MKIFLVTMKSIGDYWIAERFKFRKIEAGMADGSGEQSGRPSHLKIEDDEKEIGKFIRDMTIRKDLLDRIGIAIPLESSEEEVGYARFSHLRSPTFACTGDQLLEILGVDDSVNVKSCAPVANDSLPGVLDRLDHLVKKLEAVELSGGNAENVYNQKCDVHMPGNLMASYNETLLMEDSCTDALQDALNSGWRLIVVCPQPDKRRPDYILGRFNPEFIANGKGADRKP